MVLFRQSYLGLDVGHHRLLSILELGDHPEEILVVVVVAHAHRGVQLAVQPLDLRLVLFPGNRGRDRFHILDGGKTTRL